MWCIKFDKCAPSEHWELVFALGVVGKLAYSYNSCTCNIHVIHVTARETKNAADRYPDNSYASCMCINRVDCT